LNVHQEALDDKGGFVIEELPACSMEAPHEHGEVVGTVIHKVGAMVQEPNELTKVGKQGALLCE
jgi:hypothetical protein